MVVDITITKGIIKDYLNRIMRRGLVRGPSAVILMYHRVADLPTDHYGLTVSPQHFCEQLTYLKSECHVLPLPEFVDGFGRRQLPERAVAITFDDGYANNLTNALPLLEKHLLPATVFVTSGKVDSDTDFWWDELERIVMREIQSPTQIELTIDNEHHTWYLATDMERKSTFRVIHRLLRPLHQELRNELMNTIRDWTDVNARSGNRWADYRPLSTAELRQLANSPLIDIGGHTVTHPLLAGLDREGQRNEINTSCEALRDIIGKEIGTFSYPYGSFNNTTLTIVSELNLSAACSTECRRVGREENPLSLPRCSVDDLDQAAFAEYLEALFTAND